MNEPGQPDATAHGSPNRLRRIDPAAERLTVDTAGLAVTDLTALASVVTQAASEPDLTVPGARWLADLAGRLTRTRQARP
jgi:hypothetical protein